MTRAVCFERRVLPATLLNAGRIGLFCAENPLNELFQPVCESSLGCCAFIGASPA
jgi:hypothetical protein